MPMTPPNTPRKDEVREPVLRLRDQAELFRRAVAIDSPDAVMFDKAAAEIERSEKHRNDLADKTVNQSVEIGALKAEIERLRLDLEAKDCLADSQYKAGVKHGWNLCATDDEAGYQRVMASTEHIAELRRIRAARQALKEHPRNAD